MNAVGALLAAVAVSALLLAVRSPSTVGRRLELIAPRPLSGAAFWRPVAERDLRQAGLDATPDRFLAVKVAACLAAVLATATLSLLLPLGPAVVLLAGYAGWAAPSIVVAARAGRRHREADRATVVLVERLESLLSAGRPPETALARLVGRPTGALLLDATLRRVSEAYQLGAPLFRTLAHHARAERLDACAALAEDLERARDLGTGSVSIVRERRGALRAAERAHALELAARVEGKLMLVLALCYLPALMLLVVIPLFMSLLDGLAL